LKRKTLLKLSLFVVLLTLSLVCILQFFNSEESSAFDKELYDQPQISPKQCFANMEFSYWSYKNNDTIHDYDLKNPIYSHFSLRPDKKISGGFPAVSGGFPVKSTWEIEGDTLFILSKLITYKYILEGCPPKCTIIYFDSIYNDYKRLDMYVLF